MELPFETIKQERDHRAAREIQKGGRQVLGLPLRWLVADSRRWFCTGGHLLESIDIRGRSEIGHCPECDGKVVIMPPGISLEELQTTWMAAD